LGGSYVALDLETTGLDTESDEIIEIGAVRFDASDVLGTFETLVNPGREIARAVQTLTGITDEAVHAERPIWAVAPELEAFIGGSPVVGHNVTGFDLRFLARAGIAIGEGVYDTQELAGLLLPGRPEYGLAALCEQMGIPFEVRHRALADAEAARRLFLTLRERCAALPRQVLGQAAQWLSVTDWAGRGFFLEMSEAGSMGSAGGRPPRAPQPNPKGRPYERGPLSPSPKPVAVAPEEALTVLRSAAKHPELFPAFDRRMEQETMVSAVAQALNDEHRLLVEAGTGTGKSLAYLIPAACHAVANGDRVVVSTATINLQEQLLKKDIPAVEALLAGDDGTWRMEARSQEPGARSQEQGSAPPWRPEGAPLHSEGPATATPRPGDSKVFRACQLKGRRNYLCLKRFDTLRTAGVTSDEEALLAARILIWLSQTETGDRAELRLSQGEEAVWRRLSADGAGCTSDNSPYVVEGSCFLQKARRAAEASHIVVVNHALLLSDKATDGRVLPPYARLVVDEAHHLEGEATRQFGFASGERALAEMLDRCEGVEVHVQAGLRSPESALGPHSELIGVSQELRRRTAATREPVRDCFRALSAFMQEHTIDGLEREQRLLVNRSMRVQPDWPEIEMAWENLRLALHEVISGLKQLQQSLSAPGAAEMVSHELIRSEADMLLQDAQATVSGLSAALEQDDPERIVWLECERSDGSLIVTSVPLAVDGLLQENLYEGLKTLVLTGATLRAQGSFTYLQERLGLEDAETLALGSPFDYRRAALVLVPRDMPEPEWPGYLESLAHGIADLVRASRGRALALFTSHSSLRATHRIVGNLLREEAIQVLGQGIDGSPRQLVRALQSNPNTVLFGTASFWEGVDIVGEALSLIVMARLPFNVPSDPVFAARAALYDDPFAQYALPQSVLRFKQGFGRLIRSKTDRGVLVVLDRRITSKKYGAAFLETLPDCRVLEASVREMPGMVEGWLEREVVSGQ
jgi:DNA polymerase-3 subunit epsilon/ATP-dependent DNA helicase DinG